VGWGKPSLPPSPDKAASIRAEWLRRFHSLPDPRQYDPHTWRDVLLGVFENRRHPVAQVRRSFREGNAALQQEPADLVDDRRAAMHQPVAYTMERLKIKLVLGLDGDKAHVSRAGLDANQQALQVGGVGQQLLARKLLPYHYLALLSQCNQVKCCLAEIDAE